MCNHENREAAMVVIDPGTPERNGRDGIWCDPCLVPLIKALNDGSIRTVASCCGHGQHVGWVMLADGRDLVIAPSHDVGRTLVAAPAPEIPADAAPVEDLAAQIAHKLTCTRCRMGWYCGGVSEDDYEHAERIGALLAQVRAEHGERIAAAVLDLPTTWTVGWLKGWHSVSLNEVVQIARAAEVER